MRWIPLALIVIGVLAFAKSMTGRSSFDDGTFLIKMIFMIAGIACFAAAVIAFFVQWAIGH